MPQIDMDSLLNGPLEGALKQLETRRIKALENRVLLRIVLGIVVAIFIIPFSIKSFGFLVSLFIAAGFLLIVWLCTSRIPKDLLYSFKMEVVPVLLRTLADSTFYEPTRYISEAEFKESRLYQAPDIYDGMDYMEGVAGKTHFRCSYVHAQEEREETVTVTDSDGNTRIRTETHRYTIFAGLFFSADCNKYFHGYTVITPGSGSDRPLFGGRSLVTMENPAFNREFAVKSSDQVEARFLITPAMMERLMELKRRFGAFRLSFTNGHIRIALPGWYNYLAPDIKRPIDRSQVKMIYDRLATVIGIVEDLDINTRIWTKGISEVREAVNQ
jgi:hypothetical protein